MKENMTENSSWQTKLKAFGPGILMASAAVGGSHIVSSTQAGAIYGWQLAIIILLVNLFKYPFFRFGSQYTLASGKSLLEGYQEKGNFYLVLFFILNVFSAFVNTAAVAILTAAIIANIIPACLGLGIANLTTIIIVITWGILLIGGYGFLDNLSKVVMISLTCATVIAVVIAAFKGHSIPADFKAPSPWHLTALPFIIALMGWMPAPIEISAINSMWVVAKKRDTKVSYNDGLLDFNVGYIASALLAFVFLALGALIQFGTGEKVEAASAAYIAQFIKMYSSVIGEWSRLLIALIAFLCIFGTTITVIDGYSRANNECLRLLFKKDEAKQSHLIVWTSLTSLAGILIVFLFAGDVATMMRFAMICSFLSTPIFAWLNLSLVRDGEHKVTGWLYWLSIFGLVYLAGFALFFLVQLLGFLG